MSTAQGREKRPHRRGRGEETASCTSVTTPGGSPDHAPPGDLPSTMTPLASRVGRPTSVRAANAKHHRRARRDTCETGRLPGRCSLHTVKRPEKDGAGQRRRRWQGGQWQGGQLRRRRFDCRLRIGDWLRTVSGLLTRPTESGRLNKGDDHVCTVVSAVCGAVSGVHGGVQELDRCVLGLMGEMSARRGAPYELGTQSGTLQCVA